MKRMENTDYFTRMPMEIATKIILKVIEPSPRPYKDLRTLRSTCKFFNNVGNTDEVKKNLDTKKEFRWLYRSTDVRMHSFLSDYAKAGNPYACFIFSVINIQNTGDIRRAMDYLRTSALNGHEPAICMAYIIQERAWKDAKILAQVVPPYYFEGVKFSDYTTRDYYLMQSEYKHLCSSVLGYWNDLDAQERNSKECELVKVIKKVLDEFDPRSEVEIWKTGQPGYNPKDPNMHVANWDRAKFLADQKKQL